MGKTTPIYKVTLSLEMMILAKNEKFNRSKSDQ
jgi:hypothetical protein